MEKLLCSLMAILMVFSMVARGGGEPKTVVMNINQNGTNIDYQMDAEGDIVKKITQTSTLDCTGYTEEQIAAVEEACAEYATVYGEIESVTYETKIDGTNFTEIITIDAPNIDELKTIVELGLLQMEDDAKFISLEKSIELLESQGFVIVE